MKRALALFLCAGFCGNLHAAADYEEKNERPDAPFSLATSPVKERPIAAGFDFTIGGSAQHRYQSLDNRRDFDFNQNDEDFSLLARERLNIAIKHSAGVKLFLEAQDAHEFWRDHLPPPNPNENSLDVYQAYIEIGIMPDIVDKPSLVLKVGRQELVYGSEHFFSDNDWVNVGQNFDVAKLIWRPDGFQFDFVAGWPVIQDDRNADSPSSHRNLALTHMTALGVPLNQTIEAFFAYVWNDKTEFIGEAGNVGPEHLYTLSGRAAGKFFKHFDYEVDTAVQTGEKGGNEIAAYTAFAEVGYTIPFKWRSLRAAFAYSISSGDKDPTDGKSETFDPLYPDQFSPHSKLLVAGNKNLIDFGPKFDAKPWRGGLIELDYHFYKLQQEKDAFYAANGRPVRRNINGDGGHEIGTELDFQVTHNFHENLSITGGAFLFDPGRLFDNAGNRKDDNARSLFIMIRTGF